MLLLLGGAAWLYRDEIRLRISSVIDPMAAARRVGVPDAAALAQAQAKLRRVGLDSVVLTPGETGALVLAGLGWMGRGHLDSLRTELGERQLRLSGQLLTDSLTAAIRDRVNLAAGRREPFVLVGTLTPGRPGMGEWQIDRVTLHGVPLPAALVGRLLGEIGGTVSAGRLQIPVAGVASFRVQPQGMVLYGGRP